jgi:hypothetical protein
VVAVCSESGFSNVTVTPGMPWLFTCTVPAIDAVRMYSPEKLTACCPDPLTVTVLEVVAKVRSEGKALMDAV